MKRPLHILFLLIITLCGSGLFNSLIAQPNVSIGLFKIGNDSLEVRLRPSGNFNGVVSNVVFTLRWHSGCNAGLGNITQTGNIANYLPMEKSGGQESHNGFTYQIFGGKGLQTINSTGTSWTTNTEYSLLKIPINGSAGMFEIMNDTWTGEFFNNADYFVSLNGLNRTGSIYQSACYFIDEDNMSICQGDSILLGGVYRKTTGVYYDTLSVGDCGSIVATTLSVLQSASTNISVSICSGQSYFAGGASQTTSGVYQDFYIAANQCDSIVTTTLTVSPASSITNTVEICAGESFLAGGNWQTESGIYTDSFTTGNGCDSIIITDLTVHPIYLSQVDIFICEGASIIAGGDYQTVSGIYYDTLTSQSGCDSMIETNLTVSPAIIEQQDIEICEGDSFFAGGAYQFTAGTFYDTLTTINNCDSIIITSLSFLMEFEKQVQIDICDGEAHFAGGAWQTQSGSYFDSLTTTFGCDSIVITQLNVFPNYLMNIQVEICEGESHFAGNDFQMQSGFYFDTLISVNGCDSIIITELTVYPTFIISVPIEICEGQSHFAGNNFQTQSGLYFDTLMTLHGCDSIIITELTVHPVFIISLPVEICDGESHFAGGYFQTQPGIYDDTLNTQFGCDSIIQTELTVNPVFVQSLQINICEGESYFAGGAAQTETGIYFDSLFTASNCDSIIITELYVEPRIIENVNIAACEGENIFAEGAWQTSSGIYMDTFEAHNGCDSVIITNIIFNNTNLTLRNVSICEGESHFAGGAQQTTSGTYIDSLLNVEQCDSVVVTQLTVKPEKTTNRTIAICQGESYFVGGGFQDEAGFYFDFHTATNGCDSTVITELIILNSYLTDNPVSICLGESYFAGGQLRTTSGMYSDMFTAENGCDSLVITNLTVIPVFSTTINIEICENESHFAGGASQTITGIYFDTLTALNGCDSILITELTVFPLFSFTREIMICENDSFFTGGAYQKNAGEYVDSFLTVAGCDSIVTTTLLIESIVTENIDIYACAGESVFVGGDWQNASGIYSDTFIASGGCDSITFTHLFFHPTAFTSIQVEICDGENYDAGGAAQTTSGIFYDTLFTTQGCDSVIATEIQILPVFSTTQMIEICEGESFVAGGNPQSQNGIYYDTLTAGNGCDSIIITELSVLPVYSTNQQVTICNEDSFFAGGAYQTNSGFYFDTLIAYNGCDSVLITDLTVTPSIITNLQVSICENESHFAGGAFQSAVGTYTDIFTAINGCDSTVITELSLLPVYLVNIPMEICEGESYVAGGAVQTTSGVYYDTLLTAQSCDSIIATTIQLLPVFSTSQFISICDGESFVAGGNPQSQSGIYYDTLTAVNGCDSVIITELSVLPVFSVIQQVTICHEDFYFAGGTWRNISGIYFDTLTALNGCDSVLITELTVSSAIETIVPVAICEQESHFAGGASQSIPGTYRDILIAANGCDSTVITELVVNHVYLSTKHIEICNGDSLFLGNAYRKVSGVYRDTFPTIHFCDSVEVTSLSVQAAVTNIVSITICAGDSVFAAGAFRFSTGNYYDTLPGSNCDSIIITVLQVIEPLSVIQQVTICSNETYFAGGALQSSSGVYEDTLLSTDGCDSVVITLLDVVSAFENTADVSVCSGENYFAGGTWQVESGTYRDTFVAVNGCDSIIITSLTVLPDYFEVKPVTICSNETYVAGGAPQNIPGVYIDTFSASNGCDSVVVTMLTVNFAFSSTQQITICSDDSFFAGGAFQTVSGIYRDSFLTSQECDSILVTELFVNPVFQKTRAIHICDNDSIYAGGAYQQIEGTYVDTFSAHSGCDSIIITHLSVESTIAVTREVVLCNGDSLFTGGAFQFSAGAYHDTFLASGGCDSVVTTLLTIAESEMINRVVSICTGDSILLQNVYQTQLGIYFDTLLTVWGCDSIIISELNVFPVYSDTISVSICDNEFYFAQGAWRNISGTYIDVLTALNGCDSIIVTELSVNSRAFETLNVSICQGESYFAGGANRTTAGSYKDTLTAANGCDSILTTHLTVLQKFTRYNPVSICQGESYVAGGAPRSTTGLYLDTLTALNGCDSIILTILNVLPRKTKNIAASICNNEQYFAGGANRSTSGIYYDTLTAANGCDSVVITTLTVKNTYLNDRNLAICNGDSIFLEGGFRFTTGFYYDTLTAKNGCDSVIVTHLTIKNHRFAARTVTICDDDSFFVSGNWQTIGGAYIDTLVASNGCDSILTTNLNVLPTYVINLEVSICENKTYFAAGNLQNTSGFYFDTLSTVNGCDSVIITELTVLSTFTTDIQFSICENETYFVGGNFQDTSGIYFDTLSAENGCDSVIITELSVLSTFTTDIQVSICENETYFVGGDFQNTSGIYFDTLSAENGCDSVIITELSVLPTFTTDIQVSICENENYFVADDFQNTSGIYFDTLSAENGCDSVIITELTVLPTFTTNIQVSICENETYFVEGNFQNTSGIYFDTLSAENGCDSVIITELTVLPTFTTDIQVSICENENYFVAGDFQNTSGIYFDTLNAENGCDSVIITELSVLPTFTTNSQVSICENETYFAAGDFQNTSGFYFDTLIAENGCDSIIVTELTVLPTFTTNIQVSICENETYFVAGDFQNTSGFYFDTLSAENGCDSVIITELIVLPTFTTDIQVSICENETYFATGGFQNTSGFYFDTLSAGNGCDSVTITELTVLPTFTTDIQVSICENETFYIGGDFQNTSGFYFDTLNAGNGCDSVIITELTVLSTFTTDIQISICENETYFVAGDFQNTSGFYFDTLSAENGCDSIIVTELTVLQSFTTDIQVSICENETYFATGDFQNTSGFYFDTLSAKNGCDSVIITELTVLSTFTTDIQISICENETYFVVGDFQNTSGFYFDTLIAENGCDSVIITELTVLSTFTKDVQVSICENETYFVAGDFQNTSGFYFDTLSAENGCDSIIVTEIIVLPTFTMDIQISICENETYFAAGDFQNNSGIYFDTLSAVNGCDSVIITELIVLLTFTTDIQISICENETYFVAGDFQNNSGIYFDTLSAVNGCDSIIITELSIIPAVFTNVQVTICDNESYFVAGDYQTVSGIYYDELIAASGCDSFIVTNLTVLPTSTTQIQSAICEGETYFTGGDFQSETGIYYDTLSGANRCDSIIITSLTVLPALITPLQIQICDNEQYFTGGNFQSNSGIYYDTLSAVNGCDSIIITDLTVSPAILLTRNISICDNDSFYAGGAYQNTAGIYYDTLSTGTGCDSITITDLSILTSFVSSVTINICQGESYFAAGAFQTSGGTYSDTFLSVSGCDSIVITELNVSPVIFQNIAVAICNGDSIYLEGAFRTTAGIYVDSLTSTAGCDSILITELSVSQEMTAFANHTICSGDSILLGGAYQTESASYQDTIISTNGCDSIIITNLTVNQPLVTNTFTQICQGESVFIGGASRTTSGYYHDIFTGSNGCDSVAITSLLVHPPPNVSAGQNTTICLGDSITLTATGGISYVWNHGSTSASTTVSPTANTTYSVTATSSHGCSASASVTVSIQSNPIVTFGNLNTSYCNNHPDVALSGSPSGGIFTGDGVNGNQFSPSSLAPGSYVLSYTYTNQTGCSSSASKQVTVLAKPTASILGLNSSYCQSTNSYSISGLPAGGSFNGPGILGNNFIPYYSGIGTHTIAYRYTAPTGCRDTAFQQVTIHALPQVTFTMNTTYCLSDEPVLMEATPPGGVFAGLNVAGNYFYPEQAGVGNHHNVSYDYTDSNGCTAIKIISLSVRDNPLVYIYGVSDEYCLNYGNVNINAHPAGGIFTGNGVTGNEFQPKTAEIGIHQIIYHYSDSFNCSNADTILISVYANPEVRLLGLDDAYCVDAYPVVMSGMPAGGQFSGQGVIVNVFDPVQAGVGEDYAIVYSHTDLLGCAIADTHFVTVHPLPELALERVDLTFCIYDDIIELPVIPEGGAFYGPGIDNNVFSPRNAGVGTHSVIYSYTDSNTCTSSIFATVIVDYCTGINHLVNEFEISVFPNPFSEQIVIEVEVPGESSLQIKLNDLLGRVVLQQRMDVRQGLNTIRLTDIQWLSTGIYYLDITEKTSQKTVKLVKY